VRSPLSDTKLSDHKKHTKCSRMQTLAYRDQVARNVGKDNVYMKVNGLEKADIRKIDTSSNVQDKRRF
jgi:hypothetical protein